nr:MAG TPA: tail tube protein [Caudoviricetes sp.]DAJ17448.1 MAG TPA: tail tube protein [Siphoviridae sp. ctJZ725]
MPSFDLRGIRAGKYKNTSGTVTYTEPTDVGDAMSAQLELKFAEGRLYAESKLAEYIKLATGGTISLAVKYIKKAAQAMLYGCTSDTSKENLKFSAKDIANYVGVGFYAPDKIDGVTKYTCVWVPKALFGPPSLSYQTKGENIQFNTPTTTGEFLADDSTDELLLETETVDTAAEAVTWIKGKLGET